MTEQARYTLTEAKLILARRDCFRTGHTLSELRQASGRVPVVYCTECGLKWALVEKEKA